MQRFSRSFAYIVLAVFAAPGALAGQEATVRRFEVVPPVWITADGDPTHAGEHDGAGQQPRAFIFPSVPPSDLPPEPSIILTNFFGPRNRFRDRPPFEWSVSPHSADPIKLTVTRNGADATVNLDGGSMIRIRNLTWEQFGQLQAAFRSWLCKHSGCSLFADCESKFTADFDHKLRTLWKDNVLKNATFDRFAAAYLNPTAPLRIHYSGSVSAIDKDQTSMFLTQIQPNQRLLITWGNDNLYPVHAGIPNSYSRVTSGGRTEVRVVSDHGMRLFPTGSCVIQSVPENANAEAPKGVLLPYPKEWAGLLGSEFLPLYNLFDLHNYALLTLGSPPYPNQLSDCAHGVSAAPQFVFLLSPTSYIKADWGPEKNYVAQFETETRPGPGALPEDDIKMLARHFVIMGCATSSTKDVNDEWTQFLEIAFSNLLGPPSPTPAPRPCGGFVDGVFAGKSFVEIRNDVSVNGQPIAGGAPVFETVRQLLAASLPAHLDAEGSPGSDPLAEIILTSDPDTNKLHARTLRIRFHTTMSAVLDQVQVVEGDEIYAGSISEALR
jgi:hypothetical protein